jgi:hypothetical protein
MFPLSVAATLVLAAPPPAKPADNPGRIAVWVDDKIEHFNPDGSDARSIKLPEGIPPQKSETSISASRKYAVCLDYNSIGKFDTRNPGLVIIPLEAGRKSYALAGYVVYWYVLAHNEDKLYFRGCPGEGFDHLKKYEVPTYVLDLATNT